MKQKIQTTILFLLLGSIAFGQAPEPQLVLKKGKKTIIIQEGWIGLTTKTDTISYFGEKDLSFKIHQITPDSLYLSAPDTYHYDVIARAKNGYPEKGHPSNRHLKSFKKNKVRYDVYIVADTWLVKAYGLNDLTSIEYPPEGSNSTGCIMCVIFPFIPGVNVWFYFEMRKRWHPKVYLMGEWVVRLG